MILSASAFFAAITMPEVFLSILLQRAGAKAFSSKGRHSRFRYRYAWILAISVLYDDGPSEWHKTPAFLLTRRIFSSSYIISSLGSVILRYAFSPTGHQKVVVYIHLTLSPRASFVSCFAPLPFILIRFRRIYFCMRDAGKSGTVFATNRSSRCPASFFCTVNCFKSVVLFTQDSRLRRNDTAGHPV